MSTSGPDVTVVAMFGIITAVLVPAWFGGAEPWTWSLGRIVVLVIWALLGCASVLWAVGRWTGRGTGHAE